MRHKKLVFGIAAIILLALAIRTVAVLYVQGDLQPSRSLSELAFDKLDLNANPGVGVVVAFESEDFIIFYGDFGLFGYDLKNREITFGIDFVKAFGRKGSVQGEYGTGVSVSRDGKKIVFCDIDPDNPDAPVEDFFVDVPTLTYKRKPGRLEPMKREDRYSRENVTGYINPGYKIGTMRYIRGDEEWVLFEGYPSSTP